MIILAYETVYGTCENKCRVEVVTKEEFDKKISHGTTLPSTAEEGEIFILYAE